jgi:diguanylate cyclase (GGDEF)-like protein/putative nucleotidyltransferase with HDIG domain
MSAADPHAPGTGAAVAEAPGTLAAALDELGDLPVLKGTVQRVMELAEDPEGTIADLIDAIEADEAFAANMLSHANSAGNARPIAARTIRQAVTLVGRRATRRLALEAATYGFLERAPAGGHATRGQLHLHALEVGRVSAAVAEQAGLPVDTPHLAGLLHDVGKLVLPAAAPDPEVLEQIAARHPSGAERARAEREILGLDHALAGALLARRWGCSEDVVEAIAWHHELPRGGGANARAAACVNLADLLAALAAGAPVTPEDAGPALALIGSDADEFEELAERVLTGSSEEAPGMAGGVAQLERLATTDDLTGLANRRHWLFMSRRELSQNTRGTMLLGDVDAFKLVNDRLGHRTGDLVLTEIARALATQGRAGRLGGDEFVVWVDGSLEDGLAAAEAVLTDVRTALTRPPHTEPLATVSIGLTPIDGTLGLGALLELADEALYRAKAAGGDTVVVGAPGRL